MARALPRITKTHRWDRELFARVEALAQRTGRPVQHVLDDAVALGLQQIEEQIDARMRAMTPAEAWEEFVGSQTPEEFWRLSYEHGARTYYEAAERYVRELPQMFRDEWATWGPGDFPDLDKLAFLLADYMEEQGAGIYQAWLGDMLMGEGRTREEAIEAAVRQYEAVDEYGEYPRIPSREELISRLDVSLGVRDNRATAERSGRSMTYAEAVQQLVREGFTDIDYGDGWVDIHDLLNSLEAAAYETQVVIQTGYDEDGTVRIVALDANGYLQSEPLARARRAE